MNGIENSEIIANIFIVIGILGIVLSIIIACVRAWKSDTYDATGLLDDKELDD